MILDFRDWNIDFLFGWFISSLLLEQSICDQFTSCTNTKVQDLALLRSQLFGRVLFAIWEPLSAKNDLSWQIFYSNRLVLFRIIWITFANPISLWDKFFSATIFFKGNVLSFSFSWNWGILFTSSWSLLIRIIHCFMRPQRFSTVLARLRTFILL